MVDPIDTDAIRSMIGDRSDNLYDAEIQRSALCDEVDRLRVEADVHSVNAWADDAILRHERTQALMLQSRLDASSDELTVERAENATLRYLLARALPWIDPNDSHDDHLLTVAIREALGEGS